MGGKEAGEIGPMDEGTGWRYPVWPGPIPIPRLPVNLGPAPTWHNEAVSELILARARLPSTT